MNEECTIKAFIRMGAESNATLYYNQFIEAFQHLNNREIENTKVIQVL